MIFSSKAGSEFYLQLLFVRSFFNLRSTNKVPDKRMKIKEKIKKRDPTKKSKKNM